MLAQLITVLPSRMAIPGTLLAARLVQSKSTDCMSAGPGAGPVREHARVGERTIGRYAGSLGGAGQAGLDRSDEFRILWVGSGPLTSIFSNIGKVTP